jgi:hypothetical protein
MFYGTQGNNDSSMMFEQQIVSFQNDRMALSQNQVIFGE